MVVGRTWLPQPIRIFICLRDKFVIGNFSLGITSLASELASARAAKAVMHAVARIVRVADVALECAEAFLPWEMLVRLCSSWIRFSSFGRVVSWSCHFIFTSAVVSIHTRAPHESGLSGR